MNSERDAWLRSRKAGIGGSDAAALFGVHPWMSPYTLYLDKTDQLPSQEGRAHLMVGQELEPMTRNLYCEETGREVSSAQERFKHPEHEFMLATTDGEIAPCAEHSTVGVFEGKTTNPYARGEWEHGVPLYYNVQLHHYMMTTGRTWGSIAVLILGDKNPLHWCDVECDYEFGEMLIEVERKFWHDHVLAREPPEVDAHTRTTQALKAMHPQDTGLLVELGQDLLECRDELRSVKQEIKELVARKDLYENKLRQAIGSASFGQFPDGTGVSYRTQERQEHLVSASTCRVMRNASRKSMDSAKKIAEKALRGMLYDPNTED